MSDHSGSDELDHGPLLAAIRSARWFAGKGREASLRSVTALPWLRAPGSWPAVRMEIAEIAYPDSGPEFYQLVHSYRPSTADGQGSTRSILDDQYGELSAVDAAGDPDAASVILTSLLAGRVVADDDRTIIAEAEPAAAELDAEWVPRQLSAEQSNTSISYGGRALLKLFRRLELGDNLDIVVHRALGARGTDPAVTAKLYGRLAAQWPHDGVTLAADLAMLAEQFGEAADGWELAVAAARDNADRTEEWRALGEALAEVHRGLAEAFGTGAREGAEIAEQMAIRLDRTAAYAPQLLDHTDALRARFAILDGVQLTTQRVHGDFHLGQTLQTPDGWKIIDFEGEPAKTMTERLLPDSPWRDVAGLLRSFDYAVAEAPVAAEHGWDAAARAAFLTGYAGHDQLDPHDELIIEAYYADKAIYELGYEVRNRPDWVRIPLSAITRLSRPTDGQRR